MIIDDAKEIFTRLADVSGASLSEDHNSLKINGTKINNNDTLRRLKELNTTLSALGGGAVLVVGATSGNCDISDLDASDIADEKIWLSINKPNKNGSYYFFTIEGLKIALTNASFIQDAHNIFISCDFDPFASYSAWYLPWEKSAPYKIPEWSGFDNPLKITRDLTATGKIPNDLRPWLLYHAPEYSSNVLELWKVKSCRKLCYAIPSEIETQGDAIFACSKGDRLRKIEFHSDSENPWYDAFDVVHDCAIWLYSSKQESESKHSFLNCHLSLEWNDSTLWPDKDKITTALTNARQAYSLHLKGVSKEYFAQLVGLKKTLQDDVDRFHNNVQKLTNALWRDFIIALAVAVIKFSPKDTNFSHSAVIIIVTIILIYVSVSLIVMLYSNAKFIKITKLNREKWHKRLYGFIEENEYQELVTKPLEKAINTYKDVRAVVFMLYVLILLFLLNMIVPIDLNLKFYLDIYNRIFLWLFAVSCG